MPPDAAAAAVLYGIVKRKELMEQIAVAAASEREEILSAIDTLQDNPFPDGHQALVFGGARIITCVVTPAKSSNRYLLTYTVDEQKEKILVISVDEKRFN